MAFYGEITFINMIQKVYNDCKKWKKNI